VCENCPILLRLITDFDSICGEETGMFWRLLLIVLFALMVGSGIIKSVH